MATPNLKEVFNFVDKFLNLRKNGENATLSLQCQDGSVSVNLQLHLPSYPPPRREPHPPPWSSSCSRPSPSRVRRSTRRADARARAAVKAENEKASQVHAPKIPAEQAAMDNKSANKFDDAEEALSNAVTGNNVTDDVENIECNAEEAFNKISDQKTQFKQSEDNTAEQAELPVAGSKENDSDIENINMFEATSGHAQFKNWLVCNYCDQGFANEEILRDHTETDHGSGRIRYRRI